ncbi:hypothetical protein Pan265_19000 [Mucisphaera calidilacus]|uniref:DUF5060 domain-containing protein n=1 Tax=Mucisphaera calidilacus TaxID=2527982 RepID=A0A518BYJ6_9BACT|nr:hypothetical protein Pan265_19000 [Mucisphaera calidilacus]
MVWLGWFWGVAGAWAQVPEDVVFGAVEGVIAVEAEHAFDQTKGEVRSWRLVTLDQTPESSSDPDDNHARGASGEAYLEVLPDTRRTHDDPLVVGENIAHEPGTMAVLSYRVRVDEPGRYYVWARIYSTGTEDNGLHVGLNGEWPESGRRLQWTAKRTWWWDSKQRTAEVHTGVPGQIWLDIEEAGEHVVQFSMREDGTEFDKWFMTLDPDYEHPEGSTGPEVRVAAGALPEAEVLPDGAAGSGEVTISGERRVWHTTTLSLDGPFAHELGGAINPFTDYRMTARFRHASGLPVYTVPGYFAADGNAGQTGAASGTTWRAHFSPDRAGVWHYSVSLHTGPNCAVSDDGKPVAAYNGLRGSFEVAETDKGVSDFRGAGRVVYLGERYPRHLGSDAVFLKAGPDSPETLLAYEDFDGTVATIRRGPLKTYTAHVGDWREGDPVWRGDQGKGLIGALNYLASTGCNTVSFLTYNAGGDGDNVWPYVSRVRTHRFDCSKLDQWGIVFDHAQRRGIHLHFKLQETENDDLVRGVDQVSDVPRALDGGELGLERKLYLRELVARYAHLPVLTWILGEENTQTPAQLRAMGAYLDQIDAYDHPIDVHSYPHRQDEVYEPLLGDRSVLTSASLQNDWSKVHALTLKWLRASEASGKTWIVTNDEQGHATTGVPPDAGYPGFDPSMVDYTAADVRKRTLWGNLMAGGAGVEYYFGYKLPENDLVCEDWRSRDASWRWAGHALTFFRSLPVREMVSRDDLIVTTEDLGHVHCLAKPGEVYVVYMSDRQDVRLDLSDARGWLSVRWFDPREGGEQMEGTVRRVRGGSVEGIGRAPHGSDEDWACVIER